MNDKNHLHNTHDGNGFLVDNIKLEEVEIEESEESEDYVPHDTGFIAENFKIEKSETEELQVSSEQPLHDEPLNIEFVTEKIKVENQDTDEFEDQPLALRINKFTNRRRSLRSRSSLSTSKFQQSDQFQKSNFEPPKKYKPVSQNKRACNLREKPHECKVCGKLFNLSHILQTHIKSHYVEKPFKCADCGKCFRHSRSLETHINILCTGPGSKKESFKNQSQLKETRKERKKFLPAAKPYVCARCDQSYLCRSNLLSHSKSKCVFKTNHENKKLYKCAGCDKSYHVLSSLERHLSLNCNKNTVRTNITRLLNNNGQDEELDPRDVPETQLWVIDAGDTPYKCAECEMSYSKPIQLKHHVLNHVKKKLYPLSETNIVHKCRGCSKQFDRFISLKNHIKYNSSEEPYNCAICGKQLELKCSLTEHEKTHPRPFSCDDCGNRFILLQHLEYHMEKFQHKSEKYQHDNDNEQTLEVFISEDSLNVNIKSEQQHYMEEFSDQHDEPKPKVYIKSEDIKVEQHYELGDQSLEIPIHDDEPILNTIKQEYDHEEFLLGD